MFHLIRYYSIGSFIGIVIVVIALSYLYKEISLESLKQQESRSNTSLTKAFSNSLWRDYAQFVNNAANLSQSEIKNHPRFKKLDADVRQMMHNLNVAKVKIYSLNGNTVFSTEPKQIGADKSKSKGFLAAKRGEIASELSFRNQFYALEGVVSDRNLIASYVPIIQNNNNEVEAVLELYSDVTQLVENRDSSQTKLISGVLTILAVLYLFLFFIVKRADAIIKKQEHESREHADKIQYQAYHDALTGLPNRKMFAENLEDAVKRSNRSDKPLAVMFFDLDRFKVVNDSLGHDVGDQLLRVASKRIEASIRETDKAFRMGGDEFTVIAETLNSSGDAAIVAGRIIEAMSVPFKLDSHEVIVTTSIGIAIYPKDDNTIEQIVKNADAAMYKAKELGRNQFQFYTDDMNELSMERLAVENDLRKALGNNEFELFYQPKASSGGGTIVGMEALLRWRHPERGLMTPDKFLGYLEDTGMIIPVGDWVIKKACEDIRHWIDEGYAPMKVSVNISSAQFRSDFLVHNVASILEETGVEPNYLELELTESLLVENTALAIKILEQLKELGVYISIDDFGTGYSSLNYLKSFPIDFIKIDRSFIKDLDTSKKDAAITAAIANLAHSLNMEVVAEGVESQEQMDFLEQQGCQQIQGFLIGKPMPIEDLKQFLQPDNIPAANDDQVFQGLKKGA